MHPARIAELLEPFLLASSANDALYQHISTYIDILLRWNARVNLTAIRDPEQIVTRHFGESLFAARHLFPNRVAGGSSGSARGRAALQGRVPDLAKMGASAPEGTANDQPPRANDCSVADIGSGAGFPGIPLKLWAPGIALTLIESNHKKATFLREVTRALTLTNVNIFSGRAQHLLQEQSPHKQPVAFDVVTLRAVERFTNVLPVAASLVAPGGRLVLLIGASQIDEARSSVPLIWGSPLPVPLSKSRMLLVGSSPRS